jgi:hypothetical protein
MEPLFNCFGCGCIPQSVKSSEKPLGPVSLDAAPCACTLLHTRFSRLLPVTLQLQSTFQPSPRSGLLSDRLDRSKDQSQAERQKWTTRKQLVLARARARMHTHERGKHSSPPETQKHDQACERVVKLNTERNIVVLGLVEVDCVSLSYRMRQAKHTRTRTLALSHTMTIHYIQLFICRQ